MRSTSPNARPARAGRLGGVSPAARHRRTSVAARPLAVAVAVALTLAPVAAAAPDRPKPPTQSELRAATPPAGVTASGDLGEPTELPGGATRIFPEHRVVSLYGAPQMGATILGRLTPSEAGRQVRYEASRYNWSRAKPRIRAFELVATIATADAGGDGKYRFRQSDATIARYLRTARQFNARLILDIQPGRSSFVTELRHFSRWLREPDVDLALDPEWNVGPSGYPGRTDGSVDADTVDDVSHELTRMIRTEKTPHKLIVIHQFRRDSIRRESAIYRRRDAEITLSFDGIGSPGAKRSGYSALRAPPGLFNGFCVFYRLDDPPMSPASVVNLSPRPDYVLYQ